MAYKKKNTTNEKTEDAAVNKSANAACVQGIAGARGRTTSGSNEHHDVGRDHRNGWPPVR